MKKIIVTGHGQFATGLQSAMELLAGKNEDLIFVDFVGSRKDGILQAKYEEVLNEYPDHEFLFFCDLLGGTPYKTAATLAFENDRLAVVAGCNIGSLIDMTFMKESCSLPELARQCITASHNATGLFEIRVPSNQEEVDEDGI
jgi:PTS system N-acetylgalactosamine-specific IIA component